jgi:hypothetical protein
MSPIISICCGCGSIRNPAGAWDRAADYRRLLPSNRLSHGICASCIERLYPEMAALMAARASRASRPPATASFPIQG